jgi:RNA polymerase sigma factor (TIGR02999 family)
MSDFTQLLDRAHAGDSTAAQELLPLVYQELRRLAAVKMAREAPGQTLQATALVHEAWLRLAGSEEQQWKDRTHFFAAAAESMRRILVDRARRKKAIKHGGTFERMDVDAIELPIESDPDWVLCIHDCLAELAAEDPLIAEVVKLRCFVGMEHHEIATALNVSEKTIQRYWNYGKAWLRQRFEASR